MRGLRPSLNGAKRHGLSMAEYVWYFGVIYMVFSVFAAGFQMVLSMGAPLGHLTLGGRYAGALPIPVRFGAAFQGLLILVLAGVMLDHADVVALGTANWAIWAPVGVMALSSLGNLITPSAAERRLWAPITLAMTGAALVVALA